jgi:transposase-like protein
MQVFYFFNSFYSIAVEDICGLMSESKSIADKQYIAKILYTSQQLDQKVVAKRIGIAEKTMSKWVNQFNWKSLRNRLLVSKEEVLNNLYQQIEELNTSIRSKPEGKRYGDSKESDTLIKLTASIRNMETDLAIADLVESGIRFIKHLQKIGAAEDVIKVTEWWHSFIQASIK